MPAKTTMTIDGFHDAWNRHDATAIVAPSEGTGNGKLGSLAAEHAPFRFEGADFLELDDGGLRRVRRAFDALAVADALRLQTIASRSRSGSAPRAP
jgi:hypothetical protein